MTPQTDSNNLQDPLRSNASLHSPTIPLSRSPSHTSPHGFSTQPWNTSDLPWRISSDLTAATCASVLVSPIITVIDRGIIERASARTTLRSSIITSLSDLVTRPHLFLTSKPALLISALYFGTYMTANTVDTVTSTIKNVSAERIASGPAKFLATSSVNMSLCLYKDSQFARMFGPPPSTIAGTVTRSIPMASYALFALRDSLTIFASFNLPPMITPVLPLSGGLEKHVSRASVAQFLAPAAIQLLSTPLHLWGLDLYNRPAGTGIHWRMRISRVTRDWLGASAARMGRIVPAFGVGGVVNATVRRKMMSRIDG